MPRLTRKKVGGRRKKFTAHSIISQRGREERPGGIEKGEGDLKGGRRRRSQSGGRNCASQACIMTGGKGTTFSLALSSPSHCGNSWMREEALRFRKGAVRTGKSAVGNPAASNAKTQNLLEKKDLMFRKTNSDFDV